jgi:hypothetical protein
VVKFYYPWLKLVTSLLLLIGYQVVRLHHILVFYRQSVKVVPQFPCIVSSFLHLIFFWSGGKFQFPIFESLNLCPNLGWTGTKFCLGALMEKPLPSSFIWPGSWFFGPGAKWQIFQVRHPVKRASGKNCSGTDLYEHLCQNTWPSGPWTPNFSPLLHDHQIILLS